MNQLDLYKLLQNTLLLLILLFVVSIIGVNVMKLVVFAKSIDTVITEMEQNSDELTPLLNAYTEDSSESWKQFDQGKAHTAKEMGYVNAVPDLNGSEWGDGINIMLVGADKKNFSREKSRSDVIVIIRILSNGRILSISIPRDTLITINDGKWRGEEDKIGHALYWGGIDNLKQSVEELIGSPIYRTVIVDNFRSVEGLLAIMGGVSLDKVLSGKLGIQWIRNRSFKYGDIERCRRHQIFLKKSADKMWSMTKQGNLILSLFFYDAMTKILETDISREDFLTILYTLRNNNFNPEQDLLTGVLPGDFSRYDSKVLNHKRLHCWRADARSLDKLRFLFYSDYEDNFCQREPKVTYINFITDDLKRQIGTFGSMIRSLSTRETVQADI
jgi:anionic cell wall polymer biosynthesis LytR-Cps2A-Psr (LCP) family protein